MREAPTSGTPDSEPSQAQRQRRVREAHDCLERARTAVSEAGLNDGSNLTSLLEAISGLLPGERPTGETEPAGETRVGGAAAAVLDLLSDPDCRCVLEAASRQPRTVPELERECDIARSTVYRKVGNLAENGLLSESLRVEGSGPHPCEYRRTVEDVVVTLGSETAVTLRLPAPGASGEAGPAVDDWGQGVPDGTVSGAVPARLISLSPHGRRGDTHPTRND